MVYRITKEEALIVKTYLGERLESTQIARDNASDMLCMYPNDVAKQKAECANYTKKIELLEQLIKEIENNKFGWIKKEDNEGRKNDDDSDMRDWGRRQ